MTARLAGATWQPLGKQTQPLMRAHDIWCVHTMVGSLAGTRSMFMAGGYGGTESHTGVGYDGETDQWQDIAHTADANLDGNPVVISTETADYGPGFPAWNTNDGSAVPAWTQAQLDRLVDIGVQMCLPGTDPRSIHRDCPHDWDCYTRGIPAALIPDTKPGRRGIAYHAQGVPGNGLVAGGVKWSTAYGKVCPGARRINQLKTIVIPAIAARMAGQEDDLPLDDTTLKNLGNVANRLAAPASNGQSALDTLLAAVADIDDRVEHVDTAGMAALARIDATVGKGGVDALAAKVAAKLATTTGGATPSASALADAMRAALSELATPPEVQS